LIEINSWYNSKTYAPELGHLMLMQGGEVLRGRNRLMFTEEYIADKIQRSLPLSMILQQVNLDFINELLDYQASWGIRYLE
jgi:hypothetical protein